MPSVLRGGPFRFFFYSNEGIEPPHTHVREGRRLAKFWLDPVSLAWSRRFRSHELTKIEALVSENQQELLEAWNEHFSTEH